MTALWERGADTDWLAEFNDQLCRARVILGEKTTPVVITAARAQQALRVASDALVSAQEELGVDTPLGWRLLQLRSRLESHLLAASDLADADRLDSVVNVLRRSLDAIEPEVEALSRGQLG